MPPTGKSVGVAGGKASGVGKYATVARWDAIEPVNEGEKNGLTCSSFIQVTPRRAPTSLRRGARNATH